MDRKETARNENQLQKKIEDCRRLYAKYGGRWHMQIEREMRALGHTNFHRRILYSRFERSRHRPGWIELYGFDSERSPDIPVRNASERSGDTPVPNAGSSGVTPAGNAGALACKAGSSGLTGSPTTQPAGTKAQSDHRSGGHGDRSVPAPSQFEEFQTWLKRVSPDMVWDWCHQVYIYKHLKRVTTGKCKRLMLFLPPRHGKSELVTVRYAAWRLKREPSMNVIIGSYNQSLANRFSRKIKRVLSDDAGRSADTLVRNAGSSGVTVSPTTAPIGTTPIGTTPPSDRRGGGHGDRSVPAPSPFPFISSKPANTEAEWETSRGGGLRAVGVGGGVTGYGAQLIIIDDPVKNRAEAESQTMRDKVWDWFNDDIYTRLEPDGAIILIQTRWHEDDLALSQNSRSDYTASLRVAFDRDGSMYIDGGFRARIEYPYQRRFIRGRILAEPDTEHGVELSANGHAVIQDLRRDPSIRGRTLRGVQVKGDKITRALPWIALAEEGRVYLVRGGWNQEFIDEACSFPSGTHDDQIDAVSIAVKMHNRSSSRLHTF